jgi:putative nucleotidyltransferase with HDIG domain
MNRKIDIAQLRVGMFIAQLEGGWLDHPFWKSSFAVADDAILQKVRASGLQWCWIDRKRGLDIEPGLPSAPGGSDSIFNEPQPPVFASPSPLATVPLEAALQTAASICQHSNATLHQLFNGVHRHGTVDVASCDALMEEVASSVASNPSALIGLLRLRMHDATSYRHSLAMSALMMAMAHAFGFDAAHSRSMGLAGLVHDIGKVVLPAHMLDKPGRLSNEEAVVVRTHTQRGAELLSRSPDTDALMLDVCLHHHEKVDGSGYPEQLAEDRISWEARASAVCDVYDALTAVRPYKTTWDPAAAIAHMSSLHGHFDRELLAALIKTLGAYPCGSLVRLDSGDLAVVRDQNLGMPYAPVVVAFYSTLSNVHIGPLVIDLSHPDASVRVAAREPRERWAFSHLDSLWAGELASQ